MLNLDALNEAQRKAVTHGEGALLVLAGPGSGKTFTIVQRIFYLLEVRKVPAEEILVVTFTKDAALSMQNRFREQSESIHPVNFGTFHSIFYHILRESHVIKNNKIATDKEKRVLLKNVLKEVYEKPDDKQLSVYLSAISYYKNTGEEENAALKLPEVERCNFSKVLNSFMNACNKEGILEFDDMVYLCRELLKRDASLREKWQKRFRYILMDEFQDICPMQYETIKLLAGEHSNLFAVGDDDQAIYGFRGSKPDCLKQFKEEFSARMVCLDTNYRSCGQIVQASSGVISENRNRFQKNICAANKTAYKCENSFLIKFFEDKQMQYQYLAGLIKEKEESGNIAVLFRTNAHMQAFAVVCNRLEIPYVMKEKISSIYDHFIIKDIMAYLELAEFPGNKKALLQVLNKPDRQIEREALGFGGEIKDIKKYYERFQDATQSSQSRILNKLDKWISDMEKMKGKSLYLQVSYIRKGIGYDKYLRELVNENEEKWEEWQEILNFISEESKVYESLSHWKQAQHLYETKLRDGGNKNKQRGLGAQSLCEGKQSNMESYIYLMTVHASKGLEFDEVYIPDCNERVYPHGRMPDKDTVEEERRIFYVAMTRAKKHLELLCVTGSKERPRVISRFLNPFRKDYPETFNGH